MLAKRLFELVIPVNFWETKEVLETETTFLRRSKIEDIYFMTDGGDIARLRRQDTISKLSCTKPLNDGVFETIILDFRTCRDLMTTLGFREIERISVTRDIFRYKHYFIYLDQVAGIGEFLVLEAEAGHKRKVLLEKAARKLLKTLEIPFEAEKQPITTAIDMTGRLPYTKAINFVA